MEEPGEDFWQNCKILIIPTSVYTGRSVGIITIVSKGTLAKGKLLFGHNFRMPFSFKIKTTYYLPTFITSGHSPKLCRYFIIKSCVNLCKQLKMYILLNKFFSAEVVIQLSQLIQIYKKYVIYYSILYWDKVNKINTQIPFIFMTVHLLPKVNPTWQKMLLKLDQRFSNASSDNQIKIKALHTFPPWPQNVKYHLFAYYFHL